MTTLSLDENKATYQIRSYQPGRIQINDQNFTQSIIIAAEQLITDWPPQTTDELTAALFTPILAMKPDILLIGTGSTHVLLPIEIYGELINQGIGIEVMNTSAASRTFNALSAENRNVVAALLVK